jgi:hypothetical protein
MRTYTPIRPTSYSALLVWMAWRRYLTIVRASDPATYAVTEESAWDRLQEELADAEQPLAGERELQIA